MPLQKCTKDKESGWRWGQHGHCYTGPDGKKKAIKQGILIEGPENFKKEMSSDSELRTAFAELDLGEQLMVMMPETHQ